MWTRIIFAALLWIEDVIQRWRERRAVETTRHEQEQNDARDRGDAGDVARRMRDKSNGQ